jgi:hypothetical protein
VKKPIVTVVLMTALGAGSLSILGSHAAQPAGTASAPTEPGAPAAAYTADGRLKFPERYREWIYLSSGLDMSYRDRGMDQSMFDNVFADPAAYRAFVKTGTWPDGTLLVMEVRGATEKGSINQSGKFQNGEMMGVEVHAKDTKRFAGGWAFFAYGANQQPATQIPTAADCYSCHRDHGAVDTTFVQFYPTLLSIAKQQGTAKVER